MKIKISAPGKIILSGEHAVVYGKPALVAAVDRRLSLTLETMGEKIIFTAESDIPVGCGMGSSAALSVVRTAAVAEIFNLGLSPEKINQVAYDLEKEFHGNPSGVDNSIVTFGGFLWFRKEFEFLKNLWQLPLKFPKSLDKIILINSGKPKESTREMVELVKSQSGSKSFPKILEGIEKQTRKMLLAIRGESEKDFRDAIADNQKFLESLGVVSPKTREIVQAIVQDGGVVKVSGAGGAKQGSGMLLCYHPEPAKLVVLAKQLKLKTLPVKLGVAGLGVERQKV